MAIDRIVGGATRPWAGEDGVPDGGARVPLRSPSSGVTNRAKGGDAVAVAPTG
jgi:hypothetical protein